MNSVEQASTLGVAPLSALDVSVPEYIRAAAAAGYMEVGLRAWPVSDSDPEFSLDPSSDTFCQIKDALQETGLHVLDLEVFSVVPGIGEEDWWPVLEIGAELGASYLNVVGNHPDREGFDDTVTRLSKDAATVGVTPVLEPIAYRAFNNFEWALDLAQSAGCAVELDLLHFLRTGADVDLVARHPEAFPVVQLCDAPAQFTARKSRLEELSRSSDEQELQATESRMLRLPVGHGDVPLAALLDCLASDAHLSVEIPNVDLRGAMNAEEWLSFLHAETSRTLAGIRA